jgi:hypothetical protein
MIEKTVVIVQCIQESKTMYLFYMLATVSLNNHHITSSAGCFRVLVVFYIFVKRGTAFLGFHVSAVVAPPLPPC